jgi:D-alanyl-lipoteichoic acid acyltransferase DltB (MBOAT superfamily)
MNVLNVLVTFNFVALGWVWFALPQVSSSLQVFARLFGIGC